MRLVRFQQKPGENRIGAAMENTHFVELPAPRASTEPLIDFLSDPKAEEKARSAVESATKNLKSGKAKVGGSLLKLEDVTVLPPIARPSKIICMAGNFEEHLKEGHGLDRPFPISFLKSPASLIGHRANICYPRKVQMLDYEIELATVVGKRCKDISKNDATSHLAGFAIFNDISARDIQFTEMKRGFCNLGKNFDTFGPMGPFLVTPDQAGNPDDLRMELRVNGQTRQYASTKQMVFKTVELVEFFSSMTLEPGDIITSGTPAGVAIYRKPDKEPYLLKPGDVIESKIDNLGRLQNTVVEEPKR